MNNHKFIKIRRGIHEHLAKGKMTGMELAVYIALHLHSDYKCGVVWKVSAPFLSVYLGIPKRNIQRHLRKLEHNGYIKRFLYRRQKTPYPILINKYETKDGRITDTHKTASINNIQFMSAKCPQTCLPNSQFSSKNCRTGGADNHRNNNELNDKNSKNCRTSGVQVAQKWRTSGAHVAPILDINKSNLEGNRNKYKKEKEIKEKEKAKEETLSHPADSTSLEFFEHIDHQDLYNEHLEFVKNYSINAQPKNDIKKPNGRSKNQCEKEKAIFSEFRKQYPGKKRGLDIEFEYFRKQCKTWKETVHILSNVIEKQVQDREWRKKKNKFVSEWKHLKTWIHNQCWTEEPEKRETEWI